MDDATELPRDTVGDPGQTVLFVELAGADARARLDDLGDRLRAAGAEVELLVSLDERELFVLICRGVAPGPLELPTEARVWRFAAAPDTSTRPGGR